MSADLGVDDVEHFALGHLGIGGHLSSLGKQTVG